MNTNPKPQLPVYEIWAYLATGSNGIEGVCSIEFLKAQGIRPDAPSMLQFTNLLRAARVEQETVAEVVDGEF